MGHYLFFLEAEYSEQFMVKLKQKWFSRNIFPPWPYLSSDPNPLERWRVSWQKLELRTTDSPVLDFYCMIMLLFKIRSFKYLHLSISSKAKRKSFAYSQRLSVFFFQPLHRVSMPKLDVLPKSVKSATKKSNQTPLLQNSCRIAGPML